MSDGDASGGPDAGGVSDVVDWYLDRTAEWDPRAAEALGRTGGSLLPDLSPEAFRLRALFAGDASRRLASARVATPADRVLAAAFEERMASEVALHDAGFTTRLLAPLATPVHLARSVFDNLPTRTVADWERVADHLERLPVVLGQYATTLRQAADRGHVVAVRQIEGVAAQCDSWVDSARDDFYRGLVARAEVPATLCRRLDAAAVGASDATSSFATFLRGELAPVAHDHDAVGWPMYTVTARAFLGATVDLDEVYAYGWEELTRLRREMAAVAGEIVPGGDLAAAVAHLDGDSGRRIHGQDALRDWLQARVDATTDALDTVHFDIPARTRKAECRIVTATSGVMYYTPPDAALTRPGRVWWSLPEGVTDAATWREVSTLHHEALPGHHLQHAITMTLPHLHTWQRTMCHIHGYAEGWAHYAERLADELGLLADPGERLGMLYGQLWRACRIVIDLGLHLQLPIPQGNGFTTAERWSPALAREFLTGVAGLDPATARIEVDRYLGWPGQALAFKVGARLWETARAEAERRAGAAFDRKAFHTTALGLGPLGLDPLRTAMAELAEEGDSGVH